MAITLKQIQRKAVKFAIVGTSPLIQHKWSQKALDMLRLSPAERKKKPKTKRDPEAEGIAAMYVTDDGEPGIPLTAFKASLIGAAHKDFGLEKTLLRKSFFIPCSDSEGIVPIEHGGYEIREDIVRVGANQTDLRYRPEFKKWRVVIEAEIDGDLLSAEDIVNLVNRAGFSVGIGEWRPEKGGEFGRFRIDETFPFEEMSL